MMYLDLFEYDQTESNIYTNTVIKPLRTKVVRWHDSDTVYVTAGWMPEFIREKGWAVRLQGGQAVEKTDQRPQAIALHLKGMEIVNRVASTGKLVYLHNLRFPDVYGRLLADVVAGKVNIMDELIKNGVACQWDGKGKAPIWPTL